MQLIPELGRGKGSGTVQDVQGDLATVIWDSGEVDEGLPVGRAGQYYLRPKVHSLAPEANAYASPRQYVDQSSVDGLSLRQVQAAGDCLAPPLYRPPATRDQNQRQLPVRPVSPRVVRTRRAGEDKGEDSRKGNEDGHGVDPAREGARSPLAPVPGRPRAVDRADLSLGLWDQMIAVDAPRHSSVQSGQRSSSPAPQQALVAKGGSTIGLSVYGTQIDFVVPETICAPAFSRGNNSAQGIIGDREEEIAQDEDDDDEEDDVSFTSGVSFIAPHELSQVPERERKRERERERKKEREKAKERARKRERVSGTKKIETRERGREEREREGVCTRGMPRVAHAYKECIAVYPLVTFCFALHFMCGTINRVLLSSSPVRGSLHGAILVHLVRKVWMSEYAYEYGVQIW